MTCRRCRALALLSLSAALASPLLAQTPAPEPDAKFAEGVAEKKVFLPADFERFAPKTASDLIDQLPGFTLRSVSGDRGIGQATENLLINGNRVTDKSGGAMDQLRNVPASDVVRIEISEAASLGIAGLTGEVANVILKSNRKASGRYEWAPRVRPQYAAPSLLRGSVSYSGSEGKLDYTLSVQNFGGRGAVGGPDYVILAPDGSQIEQRDQQLQFLGDNIKFTTLLKYGAKDAVQANLKLIYNPNWQRFNNSQRRTRADGHNSDWLIQRRTPGYQFEPSGDLSFPLASGTLKLIGLYRTQHDVGPTFQTTHYDGSASSEGSRFARDSRSTEAVSRAEYHWKSGKNDWELSLERAYNRLDQKGALAILQPDGSYLDIPFPGGSGIVAEKRYEGVLSLSRPLSSNLDLQLVGGSEMSRLQHVDRNEPAHKFFRPKGSISLAWRPAKGWDASLKFERKVGQISFFDFIAQPDFSLDRSSDANPNLVPPQSWELTSEIGRNFGAWGKTRLRSYFNQIHDIVDLIPIGTSGDAVGNLPRATQIGFESKSTLQFDPIGWKGAKVDLTIGAEHSRVLDPITNSNRPISGTRDLWINVNLRHDIPGSQIAWGAYFSHDHFGSAYYPGETSRNWEGPYFGGYIEHKNLAGLKVNLEVFNITDARAHFDRSVFGGRRNVAPLIFREMQNQRVSQIITLTVTGTF